MSKGFNKNWLVRMFDATGQIFNTVEIRDKYEWEASDDAELLTKKNSKCDDWALIPIKN